jgi:tetratricopeptide (TPR) repeat protein
MKGGLAGRRDSMPKVLVLAVLMTALGFGQAPELVRARELYQRTSYEEALGWLAGMSRQTASGYILIGKCQYMKGEFKKASEALEQAVGLAPASSEAYLWLGRAYGRRAETASIFTAPGLATKARASFEKAVALEPRNTEAVSDLFEYYLEAPGLLGGGMERAQALAEKTKEADSADYHYRLALIADKRKEYRDAEQQLRRSVDLAPREVGRFIELAKFLAKSGQFEKSDAAFHQAEQMAPKDPKVMFERAKAYIRAKRNLAVARELLVRYLSTPLTPDDPPRSEAEGLLREAGSG